MLQAHAQASAKVVLIKLYQRRFLIHGGGIFILCVLIGGEVIPQDLAGRGVIRGPKGRTVAAQHIVSPAAA